jgi:hypothetical protein
VGYRFVLPPKEPREARDTAGDPASARS